MIQVIICVQLGQHQEYKPYNVICVACGCMLNVTAFPNINTK